MKRALTTLAAAALFVGCQQDEPKKPAASLEANPPAKSADAAKPAMASEAAKPAATAKPPSTKEYYEVSKNGKSYVFGKLDSMLAFRSSGALPAGTIEKPAFGPAGETVVFETGDGIEAGLMAEYTKAHPKK